MADFIDVPFESSAEAFQDFCVAYIQDKVPGFTLNPAHPMTWLIEAFSSVAADAAFSWTRMAAAAFRYLGATVYGIPANDGTPAIAVVTFTSIDTDGHTIPAGTQITIDDRAFATDSLATITPGSSSVAGVAVTALFDGTDGNGLGSTAEPVDAFPWLDTITVVGSTSGGTDAETDDEYQDRLAEELSLQAPRPITVTDYAKFAKRIAEVDRALAIDGFNVAHNLLTANQSSLEVDTTGWAAGTNTTIARSTAQAADGLASLSLTKTTSTADMWATTSTGTSGIPVVAGDSWYFSYETRAATTPRQITGRVFAYDATGASLGSLTMALAGNPSNTTTGWTRATFTYNANSLISNYPGTAFMAFGPQFTSVPSAEVHYVDKIAYQLAPNLTWVIGGNAALDMPRRVTVIPVKSDGQPVSAGTKTALVDMFTALREVNFIVSVLDPTYQSVNVVTTVKAYPGFDTAAVDTAVTAAITDYLSPANWGTRPYGDERVWDNTPIVRLYKLAQVIENVEGVNYIVSLTNPSSDTTLLGVATLPTAGAINVTVT